MTDQKDYRQYLESKFDAIHQKLDLIVDQVKRTNGTTIELAKEDERIEMKVDETISWAHHVVDSRVVDCPILPRIEKIEKNVSDTNELLLSEIKRVDNDLFEYKVIKKYPKLSIVLLLVIAVSLFITFYNSFHSSVLVKELKTKVDMINTPVRTRSGSIEFWPSGVVIDSLNESSDQ